MNKFVWELGSKASPIGVAELHESIGAYVKECCFGLMCKKRCLSKAVSVDCQDNHT